MDYDVIVLGSGQAGVPLAARLAEAGSTVLLVERSALGGTCVNTGCTPTKTMIASARAAHVARTAGQLGVHARAVDVDLAAVVDRKDALVEQWRRSVERRLQRAGDNLTLLRGHARFVGEREIVVEASGGTESTSGDGLAAAAAARERCRGDVVVINVGARAATPPVPGLDGVPWLDNASVMALREPPRHLLILGGGYVGCELGQMYRRFGSDVTLIEMTEHLLPREDEDIAAALEEVFRDEGIGLELGARAESVSGGGDDVRVRLEGGREVRGSHLLVAVGRRPNTDDLGAEAAGIRLDERGFIEVDEHYRSSAAGVYAVGDTIAQPQFTHTAWDDHRLLYDLLTGRSDRGREGRFIPYAVFTDPQVAGVGLSEKEARKRGIPHEVATMPFGHIARAIETDQRAGLMKVLIDPASERVLGAALVGAEAGELIHVFVVAMRTGATARAIVDAQFVHPTFAEGLQSLLMRLDRYKLA